MCKTALSVLTYSATVAIGVGGILVANLLAKKTPRLGVTLAAAWAIVYVAWQCKARDALLIVATATHDGLRMLNLALLVVAVGSLAFAWLGLVLFWPITKNPLGYPLKKDALWLFAGGVLVGCSFATMLVPGFWLALPKQSWGLDLRLFAGSVLPSVIVEEGVFRGRLMALLLRRSYNVDLVLLLQAAAFLVIHAPHRIWVGTTTSDATLTIGGLASVFVMGWLLGWLRYRTGSLWMSTGCHLAYNSMVLSFSFSLIRK